MNGKYNDIIELPHPKSKRHRAMAAGDRAAQFSPFAALTGHGAAIEETRRRTEERTELSEDSLWELNRRIGILKARADQRPRISIVFYVRDLRKNGGIYKEKKGEFRKVDEYERLLIFTDGTKVPLDDIVEISDGK